MADFKKWYAKVKYYNGDTEDISVRKIKTRVGDQFAPENYKDFNSNMLYSVKTAMNDVEGKEQRYYAYIGKLAGSIEELNNHKKRISWPMWPSDILEEPNNSSHDEGQDTAFSILTYKQKAALRKQKKRAAADNNYQKFIRNNTIKKVNNKNDILSDETVLAEHSKRNRLHATTNLQLEELKNLLDDKLQKMEKKLFGFINQQLTQAQENIMSKMEEMLEKVYNLNERTEQSDKTENKIHLGSNFYCTQAAFEAMKVAKNDCDWAVALLVGVFGDDAKLMRMYPRTEGLKEFPLEFLMQAQHLYRKRLEEGNCKGDIDALIKSLPAYLADRARVDLGGRREKFRTKNFKKPKNPSQRMREEEAVAE